MVLWYFEVEFLLSKLGDSGKLQLDVSRWQAICNSLEFCWYWKGWAYRFNFKGEINWIILDWDLQKNHLSVLWIPSVLNLDPWFICPSSIFWGAFFYSFALLLHWITHFWYMPKSFDIRILISRYWFSSLNFSFLSYILQILQCFVDILNLL